MTFARPARILRAASIPPGSATEPADSRLFRMRTPELLLPAGTLAKMRAEGLVATRREAQTIYYRLEDPAAMRVLDTLCDIYRGQPAAAAKTARR